MIDAYARIATIGLGTWVVCGWCGERLAMVVNDYLQFDNGWDFDPVDGIWRMSNHARTRVEDEKTPLSRQIPRYPDFLHTTIKEAVAGRLVFSSTQASQLVRTFPCYVRCPKDNCGRVQIVDAGRLRLRPLIGPRVPRRTGPESESAS